MKYASISQLFTIIGGNPAPKGDDAFSASGLPFVKMKDLGKAHFSNNLTEIENKINDRKAKELNLKVIKKGSILLPRSGSVALNHRAILGTDAYMVSHICALEVIDNKVVNNTYAYYYLRTISMDRITKKTTGLDAITFQDLAKIKILLPPLDDQIRIATLLTRAEALIAKRKESITALDEFLKSTFLVMFRAYFAPKNYKPFGDFINVLTDYHANGSYEILRNHVELLNKPDYALMVRTTDLENNNFEHGCNYITKDTYDFLSKSKVFGGEIIINKIGSAGRVYLMPHLNKPVSLGMNAFLIRLSSNINNIYTYFLLTSEFGANSIQKHVKGAVTKTITKEAVRGIKIPIPPLPLQNKFAAIVSKVASLKSKYTASLTELENLYGSLSQRAFKGELDFIINYDIKYRMGKKLDNGEEQNND
jgi:type I restriction enzyme S subunit